MSMELRFLEGKFEYGRFKLQMKEGASSWVDVPTFKEEPISMAETLRRAFVEATDGKVFDYPCGDVWKRVAEAARKYLKEQKEKMT